jgi:thiol-disulfide isomerase/thioredoxin
MSRSLSRRELIDAGIEGDNNQSRSPVSLPLSPGGHPMPYVSVRSFRVGVLLAVASLCAGCGQSGLEGKPEFLAELDPQFISPQGRLFFVNDVRRGCEVASQKSLPCLFFFTADWCTFCHRMAENAFVDDRVGEIGQNFVCILVDADRERDLVGYFAVTGYPTVEFVSPRGQSLHRLVGQQSPENLAAGMQAALGRFAWINGTQFR